MENGYYLSTYLHINPLAHTSENFYRHDHNMSLWKVQNNCADLVHYWELERITRIKQHKYACYSKQQALSIIENCLNKYEITLNDIQGIFGTPELSTLDIMEMHEKSKFSNYPLHSIAHAFSGLSLESKQKVICLAIDQGPDNILKTSYDYNYHYLGIKYENGIVSSPVPMQSPAMIWFELSEIIGLKEGTLMALANASTCKFSKSNCIIGELMKLNLYDSRNLCVMKDLLKKTYDFFIASIRGDASKYFNCFDRNFSKEDNAISALMKIVQEFSMKCMENNVNAIIEKFEIVPSEYALAITGGYALNCPTNTYLMERFGFKEFVSPPCVSDTGISLGMAQYYFYLLGVSSHGLNSAYLGDKFDITEDTLKQEFEHYIKEIDSYNMNQVIEDIINYPIVWFQGRGEVGPRALGNRSLIADPRYLKSKKILNDVKKRQWWRPVAPIILEDCVNEWFSNSYSSPYMLQTFLADESKAELIPAVLHLDNTARVQTVSKINNEKLYSLLNAFYKKTGVPILCNTSLNDRGEPIVNSPEEAIVFALRKEIPIVYINDYRLTLKNFNEYSNQAPLKPKVEFRKNFKERNLLEKKYNPWGLNQNVIQFYFDFPNVMKENDLRNKEDCENVIALYRRFVDEWETI